MLGLLAHTCNRSFTAAVLVSLSMTLAACSSGVNEGEGSSLSGGGGPGTESSTDTMGGMPTSAGASSNPTATDGETGGMTTSTTTAGTEPDPSATVDPSDTTTDDPTLEPTGTSGGIDCMSVTTTCAESTNLGPVGPGETVASLPLQLSPEDEHWYTLQFTLVGGQRPGAGTPTIVFDENTNEAFGFDVILGACGNAPADCLEEGGSATGIQQWEFMDIPIDGLTMMPGYIEMQESEWPETVFVRVYRIDDGDTCETYKLSAKRP